VFSPLPGSWAAVSKAESGVAYYIDPDIADRTLEDCSEAGLEVVMRCGKGDCGHEHVWPPGYRSDPLSLREVARIAICPACKEREVRQGRVFTRQAHAK